MTSRLIVKNIPKNIDELKLKQHFEKFGEVTDVKIIIGKNNQNRRFCFIGYKNAKRGKEAQTYFNNTYIYSSKVQVDFAKTRDEEIEQDNKRKNINDKSDLQDQQNKKVKTQESVSKEEKFKEFLNLMKSGSTGNMSWNDVLYSKEQNQSKKKENKKDKKANQKQEEKMESNLEKLEEDLNKKNKEQGKSKAKKNSSDQMEEEKQDGNKKGGEEKQENSDKKQIDEKRLYVVNLPYKIKEEEVKELFSQYGKVTELKMPFDKNSGDSKGFCFVSFEMAEEALRCFSELDNKVVFGRILHLRPSFKQPEKEGQENQQELEKEKEQEDIDREKSSYKKMKKVEMRKKLEDQTNWNTLFLNPNSILESISAQYNIKKSDILSAEAEDMAVRTAHAETQVIKETKEWMLGQGLNLDFLEEERQACKRSETIMLVKNLPFSITEEKVRDTFKHYGQVDKVLLAPNKSICIVEFINKDDAENAFKNLSYHIIKHNPIYLEWAPFDMLESDQRDSNTKDQKSNENNEEDEEENQQTNLSNVLYVKNLNFNTTDIQLQKHFESYQLGDIKSVKIVRKKDGLSSGYGFIEFKQSDAVKNSLKKVQNSKLDDHMLQLSYSKQKPKEEPKTKRKQKQNYEISSKLVVRNLAFEATKKEIRDLFKGYGEIKVVRLPQKINGQHRGFAFVEFVSSEEAKNALSSLSNTHLYGRKLVIEYAKQDMGQ